MDNDIELNLEIDYEYPNYLPIKSRKCVVCASTLTTDDRSNDELSSSFNGDDDSSSDTTHLARSGFKEHIPPIRSDNFLRGLSVFCETLNIDKSYTDCRKWDIGGVQDKYFVQYVCCRTCYTRFRQLVTLQELIETTQESLKKDVREIQRRIVVSQTKDVDFSLNTCQKFREDVIQNFNASHDVEEPEYLVNSDDDNDNSEGKVVDSDGDYYDAYSTVFTNVTQYQEETPKRGRGRPRKKPKVSLDQSMILGKPCSPLPLMDFVEPSSTFEGEQDQNSSHDAPVIVAVSSVVQGQSGSPVQLFPVPDSELDTPVIKRNRGRPRKSEPLNCLSQSKQEYDEPIQGCSAALYNEGSIKRGRGRPRKSESLSRTILEENYDPIQGCSRALDSKGTIKRKRGRPRKSLSVAPLFDTTSEEPLTANQSSSSVLDDDKSMELLLEHPLQNESDDSFIVLNSEEKNLTATQGSSCIPSNKKNMEQNLEHPPLNEAVDSLFMTTQEVENEEGSVFSTNNESSVKRKRGRPRKESLTLDLDTPRAFAARGHTYRGRPRKDDNDERRGRNKFKRDTDEQSVNVINESILIDRSKCSTNAELSDHLNTSMLFRSVHIPNHPCEQTSDSKSNLIKRHPGRPRKYDQNLLSEGPEENIIYVLNYLGAHSQRLMFHNVMFLKEATSLHCGYPNCNHALSNMGYFNDQAAYRNIQLHIKNVHRKKYHLTTAKRRQYYYCCHCEMYLKGFDELLKHKKMEDPGETEPLALCDVCGDVMHYPLLSNHLISHKSEDERSIIQSIPQTDKCDQLVSPNINQTA